MSALRFGAAVLAVYAVLLLAVAIMMGETTIIGVLGFALFGCVVTLAETWNARDDEL